MTNSSDFAAQAFAFVVALAVSVAAFGVTVAPQADNADADVPAEMIA